MSEQWHEIEEQMSPEGLPWRPPVPSGYVCESVSLPDKPLTAIGGAENRGVSNVGGDEGLKLSRGAEDTLVFAIQAMTKTEIREAMGPMHGCDGKLLSGHKAKKFKEELIVTGCAIEVSMPAIGKGRPAELLEVTAKGKRYLKQMGVAGSKRGRGRGGVLHRRYVREIQRWHEEAGYVVRVEAEVGGVYLDVLAIRRDGTRRGVQMVCSTEAFEGRCGMRALEAGLEELVLVAADNERLERLRSRLGSVVTGEMWERIKVMLVADMLDSGSKKGKK